MARSDLLEILKFLNMVRNDPTVLAQLKRKDYSSIEHFPGLVEAEREALKTLDWKKIKFSGSAKELEKFVSSKGRTHAEQVAVRTEKKSGPKMQVAARKLIPPNFIVEKVTTI